MESQSALNGPSVMPALTRPRIVARVCSRAEGSVAMVVLPRCPRRRLDDRPTPVVLNHPTFEPIVFPLPTPRFFIPAVTPVVANAAIFSLILSPNGLIDSLMQTWFGVQAPNFLGSKTWAMPAVVMVSIWQGFGYNMLVFSAALDAVPTSLTEAAAIDGARTVARFFRIVLPLITPSIFFAVVLTLISSFQVFTQAYVLTGGGPGNATTTMVVYLYEQGFQFYKMGLASAVAWVLFIIILVITVFHFIGQKRWVHYDQ